MSMHLNKILGLWAISANLVSCTLLNSFSTKQMSDINADTDSTSIIYNDSIDSIILGADKVRIYDMASFVGNNDSIPKSDSIFNYHIKEEKGLLKDKEINVLSFILSDNYWYIRNYAPIRQPFHPNFTLEFICRKEKAFVFVSLGTEEIAISDSNGNFKFYQMQDKRIIARWALMVFPKEEYYNEFIKQ